MSKDPKSRRGFIRGAGLSAAAVTAGLATPAISQNRKEWTVASAFGKTGLLGRALRDFCSAVSAATDERLIFRIYDAGQLVAPFKVLDAVSKGEAQMGFGAPYYWEARVPALRFLAAQPFGMTGMELNAWLYHADGLKLTDRIYNELDVKFLPLGNTGNQMGGWFNKTIETKEDLDGLRFRMPGLGGEILKSFGSKIENLPGSEVQKNMSAGLLDGTEWIGPAADLAAGFYKLAKHYYYPGWHEPGTLLDCMFNLQEWEALTAEDRRIISRLAMASNYRLLNEFSVSNGYAMETLLTAHRVDLRPFPDRLLIALRRRTDELLPEIAHKEKASRIVYDEMLRFKNLQGTWSHFGDGAFARARQL